MQPSQLEIQREVEALRDIRRRSTSQGGPGALILDPDLPNSSSPTSPTAPYWSANATPPLTDGDSSSSSHEGSSSSEDRSGSDDPFHLFWVPARLHPEIAPAEFRAFLKEHSRGPPPDGVSPPERSSSLSVPTSSALGRKRSMLSRQYKPSEDDGVEDEQVVPLRRNRSVFTNTGPQLTINDLQKLEELAEEASRSDDPTKLRRVLRRSLSLNVAPSVIDKMDDMPDMPDEADAPIIVPRPGQILRRAARTKIRKPGLPGDGGGHRFQSGRKRPNRSATAIEPRSSSDMSSSDHGHSEEIMRRPRAFSNESMSSEGHLPSARPESYSEETSIYDAYAQEEPDEDLSPTPTVVVTPTPQPPSVSQVLSSPRLSEEITTEPLSVDAATPVLHHPQPQRLATTTSPQSIESSRTPSPESSLVHSTTDETAVASTSPEAPPLSKSPSPIPKKEKDKRGLFGKWGSDKGSKKNGKERERDKDIPRGEKEKEKEGGFFGSLFSSKKKQEEQATHLYNGTGRETAAAMLGASKSSKTLTPSPSPSIPGTGGSYARYPIHVERAIYRLSHIKLANPRRPLYEQVLISNLMFWYLGVINKTQNPATQPQPGQGQTTNAAQPNPPPPEKEQTEREQMEVEESQRVEKERVEIEREREQPKKEPPRRGSLTKNPGTPGNGRRAAEMPIKAPQYEMQHRVMEQEYGTPSYGYGSSSSTPLGGGSPTRRQPSPPVHNTSPPPSSKHHNTSVEAGAGNAESQQLPPGAMPPASDHSTWNSSYNSSPPISRSLSSGSPPPTNAVSQTQSKPRRSKSPPPPNNNRHMPPSPASNRGQSSRAPSRSLSAAATPSPPPVPQDGKARKVTSVHAVMSRSSPRTRTSDGPANRTRTSGEEEDVPLAVWQQQRRG
ncbi:hypothetical protein SERLA73DRAFT_75406 [Serpula lacrymans var. lacrymans S7.3]|uniref:Protein Zds1 C-terminal domain-containing protein n=1 Tax=Serpula lacrymans var. lacrymans (strain S7.3) TaxID=936435 RepID=F8Q4N6_SERL3|nr:hypothetical protein SERLA73DRAFT_75406 [Serpula lacrymans var. lacrymans S7.3]